MTVWQRDDGRWEGKFVYQGRQFWVRGGPFDSEEEAREAEVEAKRKRRRAGDLRRSHAKVRKDTAHSIYRLFAGDELVYIGITCVGVNRIADHAKLRPWWTEITSATFEHVGSFDEADARETELIEKFRPRYNVRKLPDLLPEGMVDAQTVADHLKFKRAGAILKFVAEGLLPQAGTTERGTPYFDLGAVDRWIVEGRAERLPEAPNTFSAELVSSPTGSEMVES